MYRGLGVAAVFLMLVPAAGADPTFVIQRDVSIGGFPRDGKLPAAIATFGQPGRKDAAFQSCRFVWPRWGVTMNTHYPGGTLDPCGHEARHVSTTVTDSRWRTSAGLKIGDPAARIRARYRSAVNEGRGVWRLTTRMFAGLPFAGLEAKVVKGRVVSFTVHGPRSPW